MRQNVSNQDKDLTPEEIRSRDTGPLPIPAEFNFSRYTASGSVKTFLRQHDFQMSKDQPLKVVRMGFYREFDPNHTFRLRDRPTAFNYKYMTLLKASGATLSPYQEAWMGAVEETHGHKRHEEFSARERFLQLYCTDKSEGIHVLTENEWAYVLIKLGEYEAGKDAIEDEMHRMEDDPDGYWHCIKEHEATLTSPGVRSQWADELEGPELGPGYPVELRSRLDNLLLKKWTRALRNPWYTQGLVIHEDLEMYGMPKWVWEQLQLQLLAEDGCTVIPTFDHLLIAKKSEWDCMKSTAERQKRSERQQALEQLPAIQTLTVSDYCVNATRLILERLRDEEAAEV